MWKTWHWIKQTLVYSMTVAWYEYRLRSFHRELWQRWRCPVGLWLGVRAAKRGGRERHGRGAFLNPNGWSGKCCSSFSVVSPLCHWCCLFISPVSSAVLYTSFRRKASGPHWKACFCLFCHMQALIWVPSHSSAIQNSNSARTKNTWASNRTDLHRQGLSVIHLFYLVWQFVCAL